MSNVFVLNLAMKWALVVLFFPLFINGAESNLCDHCACDYTALSVTCNRPSLLIRTVSLLPNIRHLYITNLNLAHAPHFLFHTKLKVLKINKCGMREISATSLLPLPNLEVVDLSDNQLSTIPSTLFRPLSSLKIIILANNKIENLDQIEWIMSQENHALQMLDLSGNPIHIVTAMAHLPAVHHLLLSEVNIESFDEESIYFKPSNHCQTLNCRRLLLENVQLSTINNLDVSVAKNGFPITMKALEKISNISHLDLSGTILPEQFAEWLNTNTQVIALNISNAQFNRETWSYCGERQQVLDVTGIGIKSIRLPRYCELRSLYARYNQLSTISIEALNIEAMHLDGNLFDEFTQPPPGTQLEKLHTLTMSNNLLTTLPSHALLPYPNLQHFDISYNQIEMIDHFAFPTIGLGLVSLDLSSNQLSEIPHPILPSLLTLDLSSNRITSLDRNLFNGLPMLRQLGLSANPTLFNGCSSNDDCWSRNLNQLSSIIDIDLSHTGLSFQLDFSQLNSLRTLILRGNHLKSFDGEYFPINIQTIDAGDNQIQFIGNLTKLQYLRDLRIDQNPLKCDCKLYEIAGYLANETHLTDPMLFYCFAGSWKYPLFPYLAAVKPCADSTSGFYSILMTTFIISSIVVLFIVLAILLYKRFHLDYNFGFAYKRVSVIEPPVRL